MPFSDVDEEGAPFAAWLENYAAYTLMRIQAFGPELAEFADVDMDTSHADASRALTKVRSLLRDLDLDSGGAYAVQALSSSLTRCLAVCVSFQMRALLGNGQATRLIEAALTCKLEAELDNDVTCDCLKVCMYVSVLRIRLGCPCCSCRMRGRVLSAICHRRRWRALKAS